jgi:uncharacterized protein (TIGR02246 family)
MRYRIVAFLIFLKATGIVCAAPATATSEDAIRQLVSRYVEVRNNKDIAALRELFTPDADQLVSTGQWRRGLDNLIQGAMASSRKENGRSSVILDSVRMLGPDTAIADGRYETSALGATISRKMWSTFILQRTASGWRIAAIRNMLPVPTAP